MTKDPQQQVAAEVRAHIARQGLTGKAVAARVGWSRAKMSRVLSGQTPLDVNELTALADVLGVPVTAFFEVPAGVRRPGYPFSQALAVAA